jgi:hypothetical protein
VRPTRCPKTEDVDFITKDSKRFPDTHGWAYAEFAYDAASDTFTPTQKDANRGIRVDQNAAEQARDYCLWRRRQAWHRAEKSLTLVAKSFCRRQVGMTGKNDIVGKVKADALFKSVEDGIEQGDIAIVLLPFLTARAQIQPQREVCDKTLAQLAKQLPIAHVVEQTPGFSYNTLASIVGEAGDLSAYRSLRGLWKFLGVGLVDGEIQRRKSDAIAAKQHKYSPARRSTIWNVGSSLIGCMQKGPRPKLGEDIHEREDLSRWQKMFVDRLRYEAERDPEQRRPDVRNKDGELMESFSKHAANRARRHVEKQFLGYLRQEWQSTSAVKAIEVPAALAS